MLFTWNACVLQVTCQLISWWLHLILFSFLLKCFLYSACAQRVLLLLVNCIGPTRLYTLILIMIIIHWREACGKDKKRSPIAATEKEAEQEGLQEAGIRWPRQDRLQSTASTCFWTWSERPKTERPSPNSFSRKRRSTQGKGHSLWRQQGAFKKLTVVRKRTEKDGLETIQCTHIVHWKYRSKADTKQRVGNRDDGNVLRVYFHPNNSSIS